MHKTRKKRAGSRKQPKDEVVRGEQRRDRDTETPRQTQMQWGEVLTGQRRFCHPCRRLAHGTVSSCHSELCTPP